MSFGESRQYFFSIDSILEEVSILDPILKCHTILTLGLELTHYRENYNSREERSAAVSESHNNCISSAIVIDRIVRRISD